MSAVTNYYDKIFRKWKSILELDVRTNMIHVYGSDNAKKPTMPCVLLFPATKAYEQSEGDRPGRRTRTPRKAIYTFNVFGYVAAPQMADAYYNTEINSRLGLTQLATQIEDVISD